MSKWRSPGVVYNPQIPGTQDLVSQIVKHLGLDDDSLVCTIQELEHLGEDSPKLDVLITVGGDGTILRAALTGTSLGFNDKPVTEIGIDKEKKIIFVRYRHPQTGEVTNGKFGDTEVQIND